MRRLILLLITGLLATAACAAEKSAPEAKPSTKVAATTASKADDNPLQPERHLFSGKVVFLHDALKRRKVKSYEEEAKGQVVLECDDGELIPILSDWRGRAFYQDERLRNRQVDLVGFRQKQVPYLHVLTIFIYDEHGERQYMDYWCDICAIPMYEIKPCDCCQAPNRIRFQKKDLPNDVPPKPPSAIP